LPFLKLTNKIANFGVSKQDCPKLSFYFNGCYGSGIAKIAPIYIKIVERHYKISKKDKVIYTLCQ